MQNGRLPPLFLPLIVRREDLDYSHRLVSALVRRRDRDYLNATVCRPGTFRAQPELNEAGPVLNQINVPVGNRIPVAPAVAWLGRQRAENPVDSSVPRVRKAAVKRCRRCHVSHGPSTGTPAPPASLSSLCESQGQSNGKQHDPNKWPSWADRHAQLRGPDDDRADHRHEKSYGDNDCAEHSSVILLTHRGILSE